MGPRHRATKRLEELRAAAVTSERRALRLDDAGSLRLAVVADTHSRPHPETMARLAALRPHAILHGGDVGDLRVLDDLAAVAPVHAARGNIDAPDARLSELMVLEVFGAAAGAEAEEARLRILLLHIAVVGPRLRPEVARRAEQERASLVVCGHSHVPFIGGPRGITVFNPGSVGPRRFDLPITLGWITISGGRLRLGHIDCETGEPWMPP
ncbi:MAG: metallophosphoesterase family protein [Myxococcales bacterium]|nr:metallophosphoesterase family protein [Myxococcales bacterium]